MKNFILISSSLSSFAMGALLSIAMFIMPYLLNNNYLFLEDTTDTQKYIVIVFFGLSRVFASMLALSFGPYYDNLYKKSPNYGTYSFLIGTLGILSNLFILLNLKSLGINNSSNLIIAYISLFFTLSFFLEIYSVNFYPLSNRIANLNLVNFKTLNVFNSLFNSLGMALGGAILFLKGYLIENYDCNLSDFICSDNGVLSIVTLLLTAPLILSFFIKKIISDKFEQCTSFKVKYNVKDIVANYIFIIKKSKELRLFYHIELWYTVGFGIWNSGFISYIVNILKLNDSYFMLTMPVMMFGSGLLTPLFYKRVEASLKKSKESDLYIYLKYTKISYILFGIITLISPIVLPLIELDPVYKIIFCSILLVTPITITSVLPSKIIHGIIEKHEIKDPGSLHSLRAAVWLIGNGIGIIMGVIFYNILKIMNIDESYNISFACLGFFISYLILRKYFNKKIAK